MRTSTTNAGPFAERPFYEDNELEGMAVDELRRTSLLPATPGPIRIERFIEKRFGVVASYGDLEPGVLGYTRFGPGGVEELVVARTLSEEGTRVAERRISSTLAHEAGHMLLHGYLFMLQPLMKPTSLFDDVDLGQRRILCRDNATQPLGVPTGGRGYDGRWWEYQANRMIGALLLPRPLVFASLSSLVTAAGSLGTTTLEAHRRTEAAQVLSDVFDVNQAVARLRLNDVFPGAQEGQLTL